MNPTTSPLWRRLAVLLLMAFAVLQFIRSYFFVNTAYLDSARYEAGTEKMPYQARILMADAMRLADHSGPWSRIAHHLRGPLHEPSTLAIAIIGLVSLLVTALVLHRWYLLISTSRRLPLLPFAIFLWMAYATYLARFQEAIYFPYDLLDVSLFTLALFLCYTERYLLLAVLFPIACFNRETIIVLLLPLAINAWQHLHPTPAAITDPADVPTSISPTHQNLVISTEGVAGVERPASPTHTVPSPNANLVISTGGVAAAERPASPTHTAPSPNPNLVISTEGAPGSPLSSLSGVKAAVERPASPTPTQTPATFPIRELALAAFFVVVWLAIRIHYAHLYAGNDASEFRNRLRENLTFLRNPQLWSQILSGAGFLLPVPFLWFRLMPDRRLRLYSALIPVWTLAMIFFGLLPESRIFGELLGFLAVYCTLQFETAIHQPLRTTAA